MLRSRVTPWLVAGGLAVAQLGLHVALGAMSAGSAAHAGMAMGGHAHHEHTAMAAASQTGPLDPGLLDSVSTRMVVAHVLSALLTGFVWWLRRRVVAEVLRLGRPAPRVVRRPRVSPGGRSRPARTLARGSWATPAGLRPGCSSRPEPVGFQAATACPVVPHP